MKFCCTFLYFVLVKKHTDMPEQHAFCVRFSHEKRASLECQCFFLFAQGAKKCDTNHIPQETALDSSSGDTSRGQSGTRAQNAIIQRLEGLETTH